MSDYQSISVGKELEKFLKLKDITAYEFANNVGTSKQNIYNGIKNGDFKYSLFRLMVKEFPDIVNFICPELSAKPNQLQEPKAIYNTQHKESDLIDVSSLYSKIKELETANKAKDQVIINLSNSLNNLTETVGTKTTDNMELRIKAAELSNKIKEMEKLRNSK